MAHAQMFSICPHEIGSLLATMMVIVATASTGCLISRSLACHMLRLPALVCLAAWLGAALALGVLR